MNFGALNNTTFEYPVTKILAALHANRETHQKDYQDALKSYKSILKQELAVLSKMVEEGREIEHHINLRKPESHVREYDMAIQMLEMTAESDIKLDGKTFAKLVMDEWDWQDSFTNNTKSYAGASYTPPGVYTSIRT